MKRCQFICLAYRILQLMLYLLRTACKLKLFIIVMYGGERVSSFHLQVTLFLLQKTDITFSKINGKRIFIFQLTTLPQLFVTEMREKMASRWNF